MYTHVRFYRYLALLIIIVISFYQSTSAQSSPWWRLTKADPSKIEALDDEAVEELKVPILIGVAPGKFKDTWGEARAKGKTHEGVDIFAPRGAFIVSPTDAVVTRIDTTGAGGLAVYTANPGNETFYYAHLDTFAPHLKVGQELKEGDLIGTVGNTGNAKTSSPHLHFTIYTLKGAVNPFPRLTKEFSTKDRETALETILENAKNKEETENLIAQQYKTVSQKKIVETPSISVQSVKTVKEVDIVVTNAPVKSSSKETSTKKNNSDAITITENLRIGAKGEEVKKLQQFLIEQKSGELAELLATYGPTGTFGKLTFSALVEYQKKAGINPASGYCGPVTRSFINKA
jgi:hypothetical protein